VLKILRILIESGFWVVMMGGSGNWYRIVSNRQWK